MTEPSESTTELSDEFRKLGENLAESLRALWVHPETRQFRTEMKEGLTQLGDSLNQAVRDFSESPEGQKLQAGIEEFGEKIRTGEVEDKARDELINALNRINMELEKVREDLEGKRAEDENSLAD